MTENKTVLAWLEEMKAMCQPDNVVWIDGSEEQLEALRAEAVETGEMIKLNQEKLPGCYYHRTAENDVARVEDRTFICTPTEEEAGPINNWMAPDEMYAKLKKLYTGSMKGRTMYVIPYSMGPIGSPFSKIGIELSDSIYVVLNMAIMTRIGQKVLDQLGNDENAEFIKCLHAKKDVNPDDRYIVQFPQDNTIWSINSAYGGNVLLGKKCFALRIASYLGKNQGWMAEHMLILGLENPQGEVKYICAAFPSACGKTNLAMLIPPEYLKNQGYKVWTVGDDISWLNIGPDGRLYAINPEAGFFGVAPGTSVKTNFNALESTKKNEMASLKKNTQQQKDYKAKIEADIKAQDNLIASIEAKIKAEEANKNNNSNNGGSNNSGSTKYDGGAFKWPTVSTRITSPYGDMDGRTSPHQGIDIGAVNRGVSGDPIYAAADGKVVISQFSSSAGNYIMLYHGDGLYTRYLHASSLLVGVGEYVKKGQKIALMGTTGNSDGVHLHFDVRLNGVVVNPWNYLSK